MTGTPSTTRAPRRASLRRALPCAAALALAVLDCAAAGPRTVVLLHGLNRTSGSMQALSDALAGEGRRVVNLDYPSGRYPVAELAERVHARVAVCCARAAARGGIDFVTHSLGGIVVRALRARHPELAIRRVVMLAPPNSGSEIADVLRDAPLYRLVTGPAGQELGTGADSVPNTLGAVDFELGVIAGRCSLNPLYSWLIPGDDDGTVAVARTRVAGMRDFVVIDASHTFVMFREEAIRQALAFLRDGRFLRP